ncbi:Arginine--tRNA ligase (Arginyl-tRNA synthetase) (ArgRS) [Durusdinium trenchii]|uniref:arginine--tRNA ligase n=1 Tax=Durusdinium trenchii TaxID=1381693 RepID=A0ABP0S7E2_9DINO
MFLLPQALFECCSSASFGKPTFLEKKLVTARPETNLMVSSAGHLDLYFQRWESGSTKSFHGSRGEKPPRAVVFIHHGETEHASWYNALAVRLATVGCRCLAMDAQGFGQSDGARGYFESFQEVKEDFVTFVRTKWAEALKEAGNDRTSPPPAPGLVLVAKGFGALLLLQALPEIQALVRETKTVPVVVLLSPGFQFNSFLAESSGRCGLDASCASQPLSPCAVVPGHGGDGQLEHFSRWFPKMIATDPVDPDLICRDPQAIERMARDALIWRQGYRARVLAEILQEQSRLPSTMEQFPEAFQCPSLILHGSSDRLYSAQGTQFVHRHWCETQGSSPSATFPVLKVYDGAYHQLLNEPNRDEVVNDIIAFVNVAPQGFITVKLKTSWIEEQIGDRFHGSLQLRSSDPQRIVIDYSSPNIAKEMHVGHLRSTILGDTMANLFDSLGHDVVRLNHVGDWGTQFGMLLEYMRRKDALDGEASSMVSDLQQFYRSAKQAFDEDEDFRKSAQSNVVELQGGSTWAREAWSRICQASRKEFDLVYQRLKIEGLKERGESFYNEMLPEVVEDLKRKDLVTESDGALCVFTDISETPLIIQKADGGFGYDSTDCAAVRQRVQDEKAQRVIYVIDNGQELHMRMVFKAAEGAGWLEGQKRLDFMGFGLVQGQDGKKFKTRSGDVVRLRDLLDEAAMRSEKELRKRAEAAQRELDEEQEDWDGLGDRFLQALPRWEHLKRDAESIGVAAVKYFDLRQNRNSDYRFSYDQMLDPKGNTAVYVLYAYARIAGVLRRAEYDVSTLSPSDLSLTEPSESWHSHLDRERALALRLLRLPEVLAQLEEDLLPSRLIEPSQQSLWQTDHIYGLATDFTSFYTECFVIGSEQEKSRLLLLEATGLALTGQAVWVSVFVSVLNLTGG